MKLKAAVLGAVLLMLGPGAASAGSVWLGLMGGTAVPTGDFGDVADTGWDIGGTGTWMVNDQVGVGADVAYHAWNGNDDANAFADSLGGPGSEFKFSAIQATAHVAYMIPSQAPVKPWLKGGLGLYNVGTKLEGGSFEADDSESNFGWNIGAGANYTVNPNWGVGIGGAFHQIQTEDEATNLFTVNVNVLWGIPVAAAGGK